MNTTNLRKLRTEAKLTQKELAARSGISHSHVWQLESGRRDCASQTARRIADTLADELQRPVDEILVTITAPDHATA